MISEEHKRVAYKLGSVNVVYQFQFQQKHHINSLHMLSVVCICMHDIAQ